MPSQFKVQARASSGAMVTETVEADNEANLTSSLLSKGVDIISIEEIGGGLQTELKLGRGKRVKARDLAVFCRQFSSMLDAGMSPVRTLSILGEQAEKDRLKVALREARTDVAAGVDLAGALSKHPDVFPPMMTAVIRAAQNGGFLDRAMDDLAIAFESQATLNAKIKSAMTYPAAIGGLAVVMVVILLTFVVPIFDEMFRSLGGDLPLPTQFIVFLSHASVYLVPLSVILTIVAVIWWRGHKYDENVRAKVDPLKLKMPVFGPLFQKIALARFSKNLSLLVGSGVGLISALEIVGATSGNYVVEQASRDIRESVQKGAPINTAMLTNPLFPPMVVSMVDVGESSGSLDIMLGKVSDFYSKDVEIATERLASLLEPLVMLSVGIVVGFIIVSIYLPIFKIYDMIG